MIEVVVDDLAFLDVDAVLRPASDTLDPVASVSSRLDQLAGPAFAEERRLQSAMEVGSAVVTGAGDLSAQFVIHTVIRGEHGNVSTDSVRRALTSAWQRASVWGLERVASPPIGAGAGQLGLAEAAALMAQTFAAHSRSGRPPTSLQIIVDRNEEREIVEAAVRGVDR
ncbi:MAG: macro domain-containing protein [Gemmatimonadales bacterium]